MATTRQEEPYTFKLSEELSIIETRDVNKILSPELRKIYEQVQSDCIDFKGKVFDKIVNFIDEEIGTFDRTLISHSFTMGNIEELLNNVQWYPQLVEHYKAKAAKL